MTFRLQGLASKQDCRSRYMARMGLSSWTAEGSECLLQRSNVSLMFLALDMWILAKNSNHSDIYQLKTFIRRKLMSF